MVENTFVVMQLRPPSAPQFIGRSELCHIEDVERETPRVSDTVVVILLVVCLVIALGGFVTGVKLVRRVRAEAEATNAERADDTR